MDRPVELRVERLVVRLRGVPAPLARAAMDGLGWDLMEQLAGVATRSGPGDRTDLPLLDAGTVRVGSPARVAEMRGAIAEAVVRSIETARDGERRG